MLLSGGNKTVKGESILADVGVNEKGDFGVEFTECGIGGKWDLNEITYTADIDEHLIGAFSARRPRSWPIMEGQYCRLLFACQRIKGYASTSAKKGPPPVA